MKRILVVVFAAFALLLLTQLCFASNADSLGLIPAHSYLRSDVQDTAAGPLFLNQVNYIYGYGAPGNRLMWLDNYGYGITGCNYSAAVTPFIYGISASPNHPWLQIMADSIHPQGLIYLKGCLTNPPINYNECMHIESISSSGDGIGIYSTQGVGIYIDHGGNNRGMYIENNYYSTGTGLQVGNDNSGIAMVVDDNNRGRMIITKQDSVNKPAITCRWDADEFGYPADSSMLYWWGLKAHKVQVDSVKGHLYGMADSVKETPDTLKTVLCGFRAFGNNGSCLRDTIIASGVSHATTSVTASYILDDNASTANALQIRIATDTIFIVRIASTDPDSFYWQAIKSKSSSKSSGASLLGSLPGALGVSNPELYRARPNPNPGNATIEYQVGNKAENVELSIYNVAGQKVKTLVNQRQTPGLYKMNWNGETENGNSIASGIYFYRLKIGEFVNAKKMVVLK